MVTDLVRAPLDVARHLGWLVSPTFAEWGRVGVQRDGRLRAARMVAAGRDAITQQIRPSRTRMRALVALPGGRVRWHDVPVPADPGPDGALVRPIAVATCDLDRALARGHTPFPLPLRLGHECVAEIVTVGERVRTVAPGQRVVVPFQISCGACPSCIAGHTGNCTGVPPGSMYGFGAGGGHWGGALADLLAVPFADGMLVPLPDGIDPAAAASVADNVSDGYRHVAPYLPELLRRDPDARVLVLAGIDRATTAPPSIALYAGMIAVALGARHVRFADRRPAARALAQRLGMEPATARQLTGSRPADLVVDVTGCRGLGTALTHTAPDGICSSAGGLLRTARLPVGRMYATNVSLRLGRTHARAVIPAVLDLMATGDFHPERVTTTIGALDDAPRHIAAHIRSDDTKTVLIARS